MTGNEALLTFALIAGGFLLGGVMFSRALPKLLKRGLRSCFRH